VLEQASLACRLTFRVSSRGGEKRNSQEITARDSIFDLESVRAARSLEGERKREEAKSTEIN